MLRTIAVALSMSVAGMAQAGVLEPLANINRTVAIRQFQSDAAPLGSRWLVALCTELLGCEPWVAESAGAEPRLLKDLVPGSDGSNPIRFVASGAWAYFIADTGPGYQLWRTDGTSAGTERVSVQVFGRSFDSRVPEIAPVPGGVVFTATNGILWTSDGTAAGTQPLPTGGANLFAVDGAVLFAGTDANGTELWKTDGTPGGTHLVSDLVPGVWSSDPKGFVALGGATFFDGATASGKRGVYVTDGSAAGTTLLHEFTTDAISGAGAISATVAWQGQAYFMVAASGTGPTIWRSDGTVAGTAPFRSVGYGGQMHSTPSWLYVEDVFALYRTDGATTWATVTANFSGAAIAAGDTLYYAERGVPYAATWRTNGTPEGTRKLYADRYDMFIDTRWGDRAIGSAGNMAWILDATQDAALPLRPAPGEPRRSSGCASGTGLLGDVLYFPATDGEHGCELWRTDGTEAGTRMVKDITPGVTGGFTGGNLAWSSGSRMGAAGGLLYFSRPSEYYGSDLWRTDGTPDGTILLQDAVFARLFNPEPREFTALGDTMYFVSSVPDATSSYPDGLWKTDGTVAGTQLVMQMFPVDGSGSSHRLTAAGGLLYFVAAGPTDASLYRSDGTAQGTWPLITRQYYYPFNEFANITAVNGKLVFQVGNEGFFVTDGTSVSLLAPIGVGTVLGAANGSLLVTGSPMNGGLSIWRTDGTAQGTAAVAPLASGALGPGATAGGRVIFANGPWSGNAQLVRTDGTAAGTSAFVTLPSNTAAYPPATFVEPVVLGDTVIFQNADPASGLELWATNGTPSSTRLLEDVGPGAASIPSPSSGSVHPAATPWGIFLFTSAAGAPIQPYVIRPDAQPDAATFGTRDGVPMGSTQVSNAVQVTGLFSAAAATTAGGQVCVSSGANCACDVSPFATTATVPPYHYLCASQVAAGHPGTATTTTVTLGGVSLAFTTTTAPARLDVALAGRGLGAVKSASPGIDCGIDCTETYGDVTGVTLAAQPAAGSVFAGWLGACSGTGACIVNVDSPVQVTATFQPAASHPVAGDFNGDGLADLFWAGPSGAGAWLMDGVTYTSYGAVSAGAGAVLRALADFDGDGKADLLWRMPDGAYLMQLMDGTVVASSRVMLAGGSGWDVAGHGDFDGDGKADLLWKSPDGHYGIWLVDGIAPPAFALVDPPGAGFAPLLLADFDGDGRTDIVWRHADGRVAIALMSGLAPRATTFVLGAGTGWQPTHSGDFNGDGKADLVWRHDDGSYGIWLLDGASIVEARAVLGAGSGWSVSLVADFDGDGRSDLFWATAAGAQGAWLMNGTHATATALILDAGTGWTAVAAQDLDGDGKADLIWRHSGGSYGAWLMDGLAMRSFATLLPGGTGWELQHP